MKNFIYFFMLLGSIIVFTSSCNSKKQEKKSFEFSSESELVENLNLESYGLKKRISELEEQMKATNENYLSLVNTVSQLKVIPSGTIISYGGNDIIELEKQGWLVCDGRSLNSEIPENTELFKAIRTLWGGDGKPFFNIPNLQGQFLRGYTENSEFDPDIDERYKILDGKKVIVRSQIGSLQDDMFEKHRHKVYQSGNFGTGTKANSEHHMTGEWNYNHQEEVGGDETRPKNVYVYYLIKR